MRNLKKNLGYALCMLLCVVFTNCVEQQTVKNYSGTIIHEKGKNVARGGRFKVEKDGKFLTVFVTDFDYKKYEIGDTIK